MRGSEGAVPCETRDLGIKKSTAAHLDFEGQVKVDMRYVCPNRREQNALGTCEKSTYWRMWAAKHEYEELISGSRHWLRRETEEEWTDKHRHVARKLVLEGGVSAEKTLQHWQVK